MKAKRFIFLALASLLVTSCHSYEPEKKQQEEAKDDYAYVDEFLDQTDVHFDNNIDTTPLKIDKSDPYTELTRSIYDFGPYLESNADISFSVVDKNMHAEPPMAANSALLVTQELLSFYDNYGQTHAFKSFNGTYGQASFKISPSEFSNRKRVYYLELKDENLAFAGKDEDIRRLTFYTLDRGLAQGRDVHYRDDIVDIDSTKVYYYDEDGYSPFFVYSENLELEAGATVRLRNPDLEEDDIETVYGTVIGVHVNPNGAGYMVRYNPAKGADIYSNLSINDSKRITDEDAVAYYNTEEVQQQIAQGILHNPNMVTTMYGIMNAFDLKAERLARSAMDWGSRIDVQINTSYDTDSSAFTLSIGASYTFYPTNNITITLKFGWKRTWSYDVTASVGIETEFLIPVGIDYTLKVAEDIQNEVYFGICVSYDHMGEYDEKATEDSINQAVLDAFNSRSDWQKQSVFKGDGPTATKGGATYPLFKLSCTAFLPVEIYFDVEFYWDLIPTVEAIFKYSSHTQSVDLCVSNTGGADPSSDSATDTNSNLSFTLIGKVHFEAGFRLSLGVDIIGLYKFFHLEVYIKVYGAIDIQGFLFADISWSDGQPASANLQLGCKFEISAGLKVGIDLYLLFGGYNHEWPVVSVVLFGMEYSAPFQEFVEESDDVYITQSEFNAEKKQFDKTIGERHLLAARYFNSDTFTVDIKDMEFNDQVRAIYGAFVPEDVTYSVFSLDSVTAVEGTVPSSFTLADDGHLVMDTVSGQDDFVAEIVIKTNKAATLGKEIKKTITVHFNNNDRQEIYIDDAYFGSFVNGATVKLPVPDARRYLKFTGYTYMDKGIWEKTINYDPDKPDSLYYVVDTSGDFRTCYFESIWVDYYHWEVYFLDGFNNLIERQMVLNGEDAVEPSAEKRDFYMNANPPDDSHHYEFVGYDREFTNITGPTVIRAMYRIANN